MMRSLMLVLTVAALAGCFDQAEGTITAVNQASAALELEAVMEREAAIVWNATIRLEPGEFREIHSYKLNSGAYTVRGSAGGHSFEESLSLTRTTTGVSITIYDDRATVYLGQA